MMYYRTRDQYKVIIAALFATSKSGGETPNTRLARTMASEAGIVLHSDEMTTMIAEAATTAIKEAVEAGLVVMCP